MPLGIGPKAWSIQSGFFIVTPRRCNILSENCNLKLIKATVWSNTTILFTLKMERLLRPGKLQALPEEPEAMKIYDYWLKTFDTFLPAVEAATDEGERANIKKLGLLTSFLSHCTYEIIDDAPNYNQARTTVRNAYHKRKKYCVCETFADEPHAKFK